MEQRVGAMRAAWIALTLAIIAALLLLLFYYGQAVEIGGYVLFCLLPTIVMNIPVIVLCFIARRRLSQRQLSWLVAGGFVAAGASFMWLIADSSAIGYRVPTFFALGWIGWFIGRWIGRDSARDAALASPTTITR